MNHGPVQGFCVKMDGREFVNMPPLGLSGLPLEPGRVSSGAAGGGRLIPSTGQLPPFCTAKYFPTPLGLHSQPGKTEKQLWMLVKTKMVVLLLVAGNQASNVSALVCRSTNSCFMCSS